MTIDQKLVEAARLALCATRAADPDRVEALRTMESAKALLVAACLEQEEELSVEEAKHTCRDRGGSCRGPGFCNGS